MAKVTLKYARAYFRDRVKELRNQAPFGDPFVFIGAFVLLRSLANFADVTVARLLQDYSDYSAAEAETVELAGERFLRTFSLNKDLSLDSLVLTHTEPHRQVRAAVNNGVTFSTLTLNANDFLDDLDDLIPTVFRKSDKPRLLLRLNQDFILG